MNQKKVRRSGGERVAVIVGPTAVGKSDLAVTLAGHFNGEIISADSRQVYKGLDIGAGKITKKEMSGIRHYLLDVASPRRRFTIAQYQNQALKAIKQIIKRGKLPIIVGGTGFYTQAIVDGLILPAVKPDKRLRQKLAEKTLPELYEMLARLDPKRAAGIDAKNSHRLIRAIEIAKTLGRVPKLKTAAPPYDFMILGIDLPAEELKRKINRRLKRRLAVGLINEVKKLRRQGLSWRRLDELGLEYRFVARYLRGQLTKKEMVENLEREINRYAKRQKTWFKRDRRIVWIKNHQQAQMLIKNFLTRFQSR